MATGFRRIFTLSADQTFTSNATLANITGLVMPVAIGQTVLGRAFLMLTVGATGGVRLQVVSPGSSNFLAAYTLQNTVAPSTAVAAQLASAAFTNALANAGNHFVQIDFAVTFNAAGNFSIQAAQNTSDALTLTIQAGSFLDLTVL